jgi:hypothetical protein
MYKISEEEINMPKIIPFFFCALFLTVFVALPANAQQKKKGGIEPYMSKTFPSNEVIAPLCRTTVDQIMGKVETGPNQYTLYIGVMGRNGTVNAHPTTLVKLDSNLWVLGCMGGIPQVVMVFK